MSESQRRGGAWRWSCWLPLVALLATEWYLRGYDGYGACMSAPLLLVPGILGLAFAIAGSFDVVSAVRSGSPPGGSVRYVLIAVLPVLWLCVRRFIV